MDLSSHGRKRSSKDADDGSERDDEREQKRRMQSDETKQAEFVSEKGKKDSASIETKKYTNTPEYNLLPPLFQPSSFHPIAMFPRPYLDLSMNIHDLRNPESYHPRAEMPPPFSSHIKPYLQRMSALQVFPSPQEKATQMHSTYSSQQEFLPVLSSSQETKLVSSTVTTSTSSTQSSLSSTNQHQPSHPIHFHRGSLIQLASGQTKKVEELETEDFISSARSNPDVTIDDSTLVKIETDVAPGCAALTFSVGKENLMVTLYPYIHYI
jgi:hypothetical protein